MANLSNNQFHNLRLEVNMEDYWDFFLNKDACTSDIDFSRLGANLHDDCLIAFIDTKDDDCIRDNELVSKGEYTWKYANVQPHVLRNVGYTGLDNGLIPFERDRIDNKKFLSIYQDSTYTIDDDKRLVLHQVSGGTKLYEYPISIQDGLARLNGGFYQGFFKTDCLKYQVLPSVLNNGDVWHLEFMLNKTEFEKESNKTLNDKYPNNKGIFFYIGTRAENKWHYLYDEKNDSKTQLGYVDDYVEGNSLEGKTCKINAFIDMSTEDLPVEWESEAIDDYLSFKYYSDDLYHIEDDGLEDFFYETDKAPLIDENEPHTVMTCWCKGAKCESTIKKKGSYISCCCPKRCRKIETEPIISVEQNDCDGYLSKCTLFDLIEDTDEVDYDTEYAEDDLDISDFVFETYEGFELRINGQTYLDTDNQFLLFDRTCNGYTVKDYQEGDIVRYVRVKNNFKGNLFLLMNRTCTGYTVDTIDTLRDSEKLEYDYKKDLYQNALGLRITDDGRIGYRYIIKDCKDSENPLKIREGYSLPNIIKQDKWHTVNVRVRGFAETMVLEFYVDGKLIFLTSEMPKLNLRKLDDLDEKQETVPFNISLGGGTQGLCDVILPNYMLDPYKEYPLEQNFGGSFIGYIRKFRFYSCNMEFYDVVNNFRCDSLG